MLKHAFQLGMQLAFDEAGLSKEAGLFGEWGTKAMAGIKNLMGGGAKKPLTGPEAFHQKFMDRLEKGDEGVGSAYNKYRKGISAQQRTGGTGVPKRRGTVYAAP